MHGLGSWSGSLSTRGDTAPWNLVLVNTALFDPHRIILPQLLASKNTMINDQTNMPSTGRKGERSVGTIPPGIWECYLLGTVVKSQ